MNFDQEVTDEEVGEFSNTNPRVTILKDRTHQFWIKLNDKEVDSEIIKEFGDVFIGESLLPRPNPSISQAGAESLNLNLTGISSQSDEFKVREEYFDWKESLYPKNQPLNQSIHYTRSQKYLSVGVSSTRGSSPFHIIFQPEVGYQIYGTRKKTGKPFVKGILFRGANFPYFSKVKIDLASNESVRSFDASITEGEVNFKVMEFTIVNSRSAQFNWPLYLRIIVTENADVLPLSIGSVPMYLTPMTVTRTPEGALVLKHESTQAIVSSGGVKLEKSGNLDLANPWKSLTEIYGADFNRDSIFNDQKALKNEDWMLERQMLGDDLFSLELPPRPADHPFKKTKVIQDLAAERRSNPHFRSGWRMSQNLLFKNDVHELTRRLLYLQTRSLLNTDPSFLPTVTFDLPAGKFTALEYFFWNFESRAQNIGVRLFFLDLNETQSRTQDRVYQDHLIEDYLALKGNLDPAFFVTLKDERVEVAFLKRFPDAEIDLVMERNHPNICRGMLLHQRSQRN